MDTHFDVHSSMQHVNPSPVPSHDGSYCSYSSRHTTPQPDMHSSFIPIQVPTSDYCISPQLVMPEAIKMEQRGHVISPHDDLVELLTSTAPSSEHFTVTDVNITSPQFSWATDSDVMFTGTPVTAQSSSEMTYVSSSNFSAIPSSSILSTAASAAGLISNKRPLEENTLKSKPKRRRVINKGQRTAANQRERRRMVTLNDAFDDLKERIPTFNHEKKLSRIETLRLAIAYISFMGQLVNGKEPQDVTLNFPFISENSQSAQSSHSDVMTEYSHMIQNSLPSDSMVPMDMNYAMDMTQQCNTNGYYPNGMFMTQ